MAAEKAEILLIGAAKPAIVGGLEPSLDRSQADRGQGPGSLYRGDRAAHPRDRDRLYRQQDRRRLHVALPEARNRVELRRRLRPCRREMGGRARHRRDQHPRRAERGSRRHRDRTAALHLARISAGRPLSARRQMAQERLSADRRRCAAVPSALSAWAASARRSGGGSKPSACRWSITRAIRRPASPTNIIRS